ncbi:hypothetical protein DEV91_1544 [Phyllobacterium brassicacearum]|nr:hypothetical protein DEV91_1544 [Phyllobacterium brassicacearum]
MSQAESGESQMSAQDMKDLDATNYSMKHPKRSKVASTQARSLLPVLIASIWRVSAACFFVAAVNSSSTDPNGTDTTPSASPQTRSPGWITIPFMAMGTFTSPGPSL